AGTSSNAHTYRLFIVKELRIRYCLAAFANRFVRQQQRSEIMQCFAMFVNFFFSFLGVDFLWISTVP
ncbi:hypothetical protein, partial [Massilia sp. Root133]|uniref:hypothetical protein n=1 Tax=Massilia sp. Root133 TaxID=1736455 RepID=UPI001E56363A